MLNLKPLKVGIYLLMVYLVLDVTVKSKADDDFAEFDEDDHVLKPIHKSDHEKFANSVDLKEQEMVPDVVSDSASNSNMELEGDNDDNNNDMNVDFARNSAVSADDFDDYEMLEDETEDSETKLNSSQIDLPNTNERQKITIKKAPVGVGQRLKWAEYWIELILAFILAVFVINFVVRRETNQKIARTWLGVHQSLLRSSFSIVGETFSGAKLDSDSSSESTLPLPSLVCESDSFFSLWCSGRVCCEGMLVQLKLLKRQDFFSLFIGYLLKNKWDKLRIKVVMKTEFMSNFIVCVATKKTASKLCKKLNDLVSFGLEKKPAENYHMPESLNVFSEIHEATVSLFDAKVRSVIHEFKDNIDYIHISDQYSGLKNPEDGQTQNLTMAETQKVLIFEFNMPQFSSNDVQQAIESTKPLMSLVIHLIDKVRKLNLSKEARHKSDANRARIQKEFLKNTQAVRAEAAAAKRLEKRKQERERIMASEDIEKQRKWEEREHKREMKKRTPKMHLFKIKSV